MSLQGNVNDVFGLACKLCYQVVPRNPPTLGGGGCQRAKSLTLQYPDVVTLRDKLVQALQYQHQLMRAMVSPKYANEKVEVLSLKAEKLAQEIEVLYDKLDELWSK